MKKAFSRYADFIQEYIYKKGWNALNESQEETCAAILDTDKDVILASPTASGKTEAVFFPILTELEQNPPESVGILYIAPLKALINDQYGRLSELLEGRLPVWAWHGDIPQSKKEQAKAQNKGIIQITPESLEALLIRHPQTVRKLFSDLRYVVIDEIHSLMGTDRGLQVISLIERIERMTGNRPRRIGLSATLSDYTKSREYLTSGEPERALALGLKNSKERLVKLRVDTFDESDGEVLDLPDLDYLYERTRKTKSLIFLNSREDAENTILKLKSLAASRNDRDIFFVHHGSISPELRREAEKALKTSQSPVVVAATITLELGIDIGNLDQIVQIGAPYSCSSFVQRLGRSGRQNDELAMRFINYHTIPEDYAPEKMPWELLRSVAIIELYLKERWIEPARIKEKPYSLLIQQTLSTLMSYSNLSPRDLARLVLTLSPFRGRISQEEYRILLNHLIDLDYVQQLEDKSLIIGLMGERLVNHHSFYAVFAESEEYRVLNGDTEIGTLSFLPEVGDAFSLAGRSWVAVDVDEARHIVYVDASASGKGSHWSGTGIEVHKRIVKKIREILENDETYPYLSPRARESLEWARNCARESGILDGIVEEDGRITVYPWSGTVENRTLMRLLQNRFRYQLRIKQFTPGMYSFSFKSGYDAETFVEKLKGLDLSTVGPGDVLGEQPAPNTDKYDSLLPDILKEEAFLLNNMDIAGAREIIENIDYKPDPYVESPALSDFLNHLFDDYFN